MISEIPIEWENGHILCSDNRKVLNIENRCSICCDGYKEVDVIIQTECQHAFHKDCMIKWLWENNNCPNCRKKVNKNDAKKRGRIWSNMQITKKHVNLLLTIWYVTAIAFIILSVLFWISMERPFFVEKYDFPIEMVLMKNITSVCRADFILCDDTMWSILGLTTFQELLPLCPSGNVRCFATQNRIVLALVLYDTVLSSSLSWVIILWMFLMPFLCVLLICSSLFLFLLFPKARNASYLFITLMCIGTLSECIKHLILTSVYV